MIELLKNGTCPFTGKRYDCARCEEYTKLKRSEHVGGGAVNFNLALYFADAIRDGKRGIKWLHKYSSPNCTLAETERLYAGLYQLGATHYPIGNCDRFCFRRGCMGHTAEGGAK